MPKAGWNPDRLLLVVAGLSIAAAADEDAAQGKAGAAGLKPFGVAAALPYAIDAGAG
jgi:hypothetical protein